MSNVNESRQRLKEVLLNNFDTLTPICADQLVQGIEEIINAYKEDLRK
jgi:hypothetical protein